MFVNIKDKNSQQNSNILKHKKIMDFKLLHPKKFQSKTCDKNLVKI